MDTINNNKKGNYVLSASILIAAVLISGAVIYSKGLSVANQGANQGKADVSAVAVADPFIVQKDDIVLGEAGAPVTIFIYSDPSCPFCAAAAGGNQEVIDYLKKGMPTWTPPIPGIIKDYVNTGKARLIFRYSPGHGTGEEAMKILYCANEQGKFWQLHDVIADNQSLIEDVNKIKEFASGVGADVSKINACLESKKYDNKLLSDTELAAKAGVNGTPAFFINKISKAGAQPYSEFKKVIDTILQNQ